MLTVSDFFCGCGGLSQGFKEAGFDIKTGIDFNKSFLETLLPYYQESKRFYVERDFSYNSFVNIIRQICKSGDIMFTSKIKYNESKYNIDYFIYF